WCNFRFEIPQLMADCAQLLLAQLGQSPLIIRHSQRLGAPPQREHQRVNCCLGHAVHHRYPFNQNAISSSKSSARDLLVAGGLSCFGLIERLRYFLPVFLEVRTQPESQYSVPSTSSVPL